MASKKRLLPALVASLFIGFAPPKADAAQFSAVYVFGDSLSDAGFYRPFLLGLGLPAAVVAQLGRFTTNPGPVWSELISQFYGFTPAPSNAGGNIFAQGGARVASNSAATPSGFAQRPVSVQIDEALARTGGAADPNALYVVWAGGNDFLQNSAAFTAGQITQAQFQGNVLAAATAEIQQIARLQAAGARHIMVFGLPDIGASPAGAAGGPAAAAGATALSAGFNTTLFTGLAAAGIRAIPVDVFALLADIRTNAGAFGFTNLTGIACGPFPGVTTSGNAQFCLPSNLVAPNAADTFLFADSVHPTTATHRIIADFAESLIEGPTQYGLLAEAALATRSSHIRTINDGLLNGRKGEVGKLGVFAAIDGGKHEIDAGIGNTGIDGQIRALSVGLTMRASEAVTLGVAYGQGRNEADFGQGAGSFELQEKTWSLFAGGRWGGLYANAVVSLADLDYDNTQRRIVLGPVTRIAESRQEGSNASAHVALGYDFLVGRSLTVGPTVSVTTQNVTVNGFDEAGGGSAGLRLHEQKRRSEIWSAGVRASMALGQWTPWLRVTADKERRDDERFVSATPLSLAAIGNTFDIPAYRPDSTFMTTSVGLNGLITERIGLGVAYTHVSGRSGMSEGAATAVVSVAF